MVANLDLSSFSARKRVHLPPPKTWDVKNMGCPMQLAAQTGSPEIIKKRIFSDVEFLQKSSDTEDLN